MCHWTDGLTGNRCDGRLDRHHSDPAVYRPIGPVARLNTGPTLRGDTEILCRGNRRIAERRHRVMIPSWNDMAAGRGDCETCIRGARRTSTRFPMRKPQRIEFYRFPAFATELPRDQGRFGARSLPPMIAERLGAISVTPVSGPRRPGWKRTRQPLRLSTPHDRGKPDRCYPGTSEHRLGQIATCLHRHLF